MDKTELIQHWSYFGSLAERLDETKHFIDHGLYENESKLELVHGKVYSDVFKQIIVLAASEFEVMSKALCLCKGHSTGNIVDISKAVLHDYPKIVNFEVSSPFWINKPLEEWDVCNDTVLGLDWWKAYNSIKHGNKDSFESATLQNAILSLESLYIIDLYVMYELFGDMGIAYSYPIVYFRCKYLAYSTNMGEGRLPDYGDLSPSERIKQKYPDLFIENDNGEK